MSCFTFGFFDFFVHFSKYIFDFNFNSLTDAHLAALTEDFNEEDEDPFSGDDPNDADWQAPNEEESDVDDVLLLDDMNGAVEIEEEEDSDDEFVDEDDAAEQDELFNSRAGTTWKKDPPPPSQTRRHNIIREAGNNYRNHIA